MNVILPTKKWNYSSTYNNVCNYVENNSRKAHFQICSKSINNISQIVREKYVDIFVFKLYNTSSIITKIIFASKNHNQTGYEFDINNQGEKEK